MTCLEVPYWVNIHYLPVIQQISSAGRDGLYGRRLFWEDRDLSRSLINIRFLKNLSSFKNSFQQRKLCYFKSSTLTHNIRTWSLLFPKLCKILCSPNFWPLAFFSASKRSHISFGDKIDKILGNGFRILYLRDMKSDDFLGVRWG